MNLTEVQENIYRAQLLLGDAEEAIKNYKDGVATDDGSLGYLKRCEEMYNNLYKDLSDAIISLMAAKEILAAEREKK